MANYADVKAIIDTYIKRNGIKAITGDILNGVLNAMLTELGAGYQYGGMADPATDPGAPDYNVVYLAATAGTYTNFDGITLAEGEIALLKYNGSWSKETVGDFYSRDDINSMLDYYVQKVPGKGLSTNDYTNEDKAKLDGIEPGAQVNVIEGVSVNGYRLQPDQNKVVDVDVPTDLSELREDAEHRLVTDDQIAGWNAKYDKPAGGIPAADLAQAVRDLLALADSSLQPDDIVQETGEQTGKVMSQKAVTDAIKEGAGKDGYYPGLIAGNADALMGRPSNAEILFAPYPGARGNALIQSIYGKTVVWNQLATARSSASAVSGITRTKVNDYCIHYSGTSESATNFTATNTNISVIAGHKYYIATKGIPSTCRCNEAGVGESAVVKTINGTVSNYSFGVVVPQGVAIDNDVYVKMCDLTQMGIADIISTPADFERWYSANYYAFNAGTLLSNKAAAIESRGFNQWDEQWELGTFDNNGQPVTSTTRIRSKNYTRILPEVQYFFCIPNTASGSYMGDVIFYDAAKNFISLGYFGPRAFEILTAPDNAHYLRFSPRVDYGTTYNHDICINLSDTARNGEYEPYTLTTLRLDLTTLTGKLNGEGESVVIAPEGLAGNGDWADQGIVENGYLTKIVKNTPRVAVDLGDLTWERRTAEGQYVFQTTINDAVRSASGAVGAAVCSGYQNVFDAKDTDKSIQVNTTANAAGVVRVRDDYYTDASTFKTGVTGVKLIYQLATPQVYVLDTPIPVTYAVENGGTERILPDGVDLQGVPATAPFPFQRRFPIDIIDDVTKPMLDAAVTAGIIAGYTVTWNEATGQFDFTFTAPTNRSVSLGNPFARPDTDKADEADELEKKGDVEATEDIGGTAYTETETKAELTK